MDLEEFGKSISMIRKKQNISQKTLALDLDISRATLSSFENTKGVNIGFKKVLSIIDYLGYEVCIKEKSPFPTFEELKNEY